MQAGAETATGGARVGAGLDHFIGRLHPGAVEMDRGRNAGAVHGFAAEYLAIGRAPSDERLGELFPQTVIDARLPRLAVGREPDDQLGILDRGAAEFPSGAFEIAERGDAHVSSTNILLSIARGPYRTVAAEQSCAVRLKAAQNSPLRVGASPVLRPLAARATGAAKRPI